MNKIKEIRSQLDKAAFFIGNGINLNAGIMQSWEDLLSSLTNSTLLKEGLTNTEIYDLIELSLLNHSGLKQKVANGLYLTENKNLEPHKRLMRYALETKTPVMTSNFDLALAKSVQAKKFHTSSEGFTRYYPWKTYYGREQLSNPQDGFSLHVDRQPRALLDNVKGLEVVGMDKAEVCCGFGGTFSIKFPEISTGMMDEKLDCAARTGVKTMIAGDTGCIMHMAGGLRRRGSDMKILHLAQLLDQASSGERGTG